jgi:hypothetical protein
MKLHVQPVYGWGWFDSKTVSLDVPEPFDLVVSVVEKGSPFKTALGKVEVATHSLFGLWVLLTQRHGSDFNLSAFKEMPVLPDISEHPPYLTGFANVTTASHKHWSSPVR